MRRTDKLWGGFSLIQDDRFFKLGQDTMLLSDFACPPARASIMDLGCGNGALSVLLCARHPHITVTGLENSAGSCRSWRRRISRTMAWSSACG